MLQTDCDGFRGRLLKYLGFLSILGVNGFERPIQEGRRRTFCMWGGGVETLSCYYPYHLYDAFSYYYYICLLVRVVRNTISYFV